MPSCGGLTGCAVFIRRTIREMWARKNINLTVIFAALSFYDFARRLPAEERPTGLRRVPIEASAAWS
jgi:hypothetical protein